MKAGSTYIFQGFNPECDPTYRKKLMAMGFIPGTLFTVKRIAPLGDPIMILIKGTHLSLRKSEMAMLRIKEDVV